MKVIEHKLRERNLEKPQKRLYIAIVLNILIVLLQVIYGFISNSISLLADALHNLQDVVALIIAVIAVIFTSKLPTKDMTYGFIRSEALAGFVNSLALMITLFVIILFAIKRLISPEVVEGLYVAVFGLLGFVINLVSAKIIHIHHHEEENHNHEDLNIKSAYLHLLSDAGISLAVFLGGLAIYFYKIYWIDPLLSLIFSIYILKETFPVLKDSYNILMEAVPKHIDVDRLILELREEFKSIKEIHDLHIWSLSSADIYLSAHIVIDNLNLSEYEKLLYQLENFFKERGINHITIQPETENFNCQPLH